MSNPSYRVLEQNNKEIVLPKHDNSLVMIVLFLIFTGLLAIFSAGAPKCIINGLPAAYFVSRQFIWFILGFIAMFIISKINYKVFDKLSIPFAWLVVILLIAVHFAGVKVNGAQRWLDAGFIQFQPSEACKLAVIMLLGSAFSRDTSLLNIKLYKYYFPILIMLFLIFKQPNLSMVLILVLSSVFVYFASGGSIKLILAAGAAGVFALSRMLHSFQRQRIEIWKNPELDPYGAGYNIIQAMMAFAAGGLWGEGYGNSVQKLGWLPEGHTDFIFAVFAEEFGFLGCLLVIGLFLAFLQRGIVISSRCGDIFGKLLASGITVSICLQAFINIAVSSSMIPATGVPMPFISYGGTSLFITMCMTGILLNISRRRVIRLQNV